MQKRKTASKSVTKTSKPKKSTKKKTVTKKPSAKKTQARKKSKELGLLTPATKAKIVALLIELEKMLNTAEKKMLKKMT